MLLLPRTPKPYSAESLLGYILRSSEENGYESPKYVMQHLGFTSKKLVPTLLPVEKFASALGRKPEELKQLEYSTEIKTGGREFRILGHSLGPSIKRYHLRLNTPRFCPDCVKQQGFLDALWDLELVTACPKHKTRLLESCPNCGHEIKWYRPGLLKCTCGATFTPTDSPITDEIIELTEIIKSTVHRSPLSPMTNVAKFPVAELTRLPLRSLLTVINILGHHQANGHKTTPEETIHGAIEALKNWPSGFHNFLREIDKNNNKINNINSLGLRKRFSSLYYSLFKCSEMLEGTEFIRAEFIRFGMHEWGEGVIDSKMLENDAPPQRFQSLTQLASHLGVQPTTLKKWGKLGLVPLKIINIGKLKRYIIDLQSVPVKKGTPGKTMSDRQAAAFLGLPVSVLKSLRVTGDYKSTFLATRLKSFHEDDVINFKNSILSLAPMIADIPEEATSLAQIMRRKFISPDGKANFIREILSHQIPSIGRNDEHLSDVYFRVDYVDRFIKSEQVIARDNTWSLSETAKYIHCDPILINSLIEDGYLDAVDVTTGRRITEESLMNFEAQYISLAKISKATKSSSTKLLSICEEKCIPLKIFERGYGKSKQSFIRKIDLLMLNITNNQLNISIFS
ncbi:MAG: TniQ family protein [Gallionella sp.]